MGAVAAVAGVGTASAAIVPTVLLASSADDAVLAGSGVMNNGPTILDGSLGVAPGTAISGFPPGLVLPPGTTDVANGAAMQAQADLTAAYNDAAGRPIDGVLPADLANLELQAGVYAGTDRAPLGLTGPLVLDGANNADSVFIFQTDSTLITGSGSTITLINGAQECNVFWQVGSSATLGTSSVFRGNILALTAITVTTGVVVHGRALARNAAVTLDSDTFVKPTCDTVVTTTTETGSTSTTEPGSSTSSQPGTTASTLPGTTTSSLPGTTVTTTAGTTSSSQPGTTSSSQPGTTASTLPGTSTSTSSLPGTTVTTSSATTSSSQPGTTVTTVGTTQPSSTSSSISATSSLTSAPSTTADVIVLGTATSATDSTASSTTSSTSPGTATGISVATPRFTG